MVKTRVSGSDFPFNPLKCPGIEGYAACRPSSSGNGFGCQGLRLDAVGWIQEWPNFPGCTKGIQKTGNTHNIPPNM